MEEGSIRCASSRKSPQPNRWLDIKAVADLALRDADRLLAEWFPAGKRVGNEFSIGNLRGEPGNSLSINVRTGAWADFASDDKGGDLVSLHAAIYRLSQADAASELAEELGAGLAAALAPSRPAETWAPMVPPPVGVAHPTFAMCRAVTPMRLLSTPRQRGRLPKTQASEGGCADPAPPLP
jgi:hypothetical protein